jgi:formiminotetrahydrofolate cyclodeaminase
MWNDPGLVDDLIRTLDIDPLLDAIAARAAAPGSGSTAALVGAMAAALCVKTARFSNDEGAAAQANALRARLAKLAPEDAQAFVDAMKHLDEPVEEDAHRRDWQLGQALAVAADVPLRIAETCADVAELAAELAARGKPELQPDAAAAAVLAEAAARAAAHLVSINLGATPDDERVRRAGRSAEAAGTAAARTGA